MKTSAPPAPTLGQRMVAAWDRFWFTPADPTLLGLIRISCGLITFYTLLVYTFHFHEFMGPDGWYDLRSRLENVRDRPVTTISLSGRDFPAMDYKDLTPEDKLYVSEFFKRFNFDPRVYGMPLPKSDWQRRYLEEYTDIFKHPPPPPYPVSDDEANAIAQYYKNYHVDPRVLYAKGTPVWSLWFHLPVEWMLPAHGAILVIVFLFVLGFCTRLTAVLTWMASLSYIHRMPVILFGVDTMMNILLLYLMIGPSGAALSVDRLIGRWWSRHKPRVLARWWSWWGKDAGPAAQVVPAPCSSQPVPSISANVAIRLLQVHVCFIYAAAGLTKLQGQAWWNGTAVWGTVANYEFAPMQFELYNTILRLLGRSQLVFEVVFTTASLFTLFFEITYAFLVWRPATRWVLLSMAILLHGFIGLFMGLKTFSFMMLVMNMAFLRPGEVQWLLRLVTGTKTPSKESKSDPARVGSLSHAVMESGGGRK